MGNNTFIFNLEWAAVLMEYPAEVRYEVYDAIIRYATSGTLSELKPLAKMAFSFIKKEMDYNHAQYAAKIEKRREAGKRSAEVKAKQNQHKPTNSTSVESVEQNQHKPTNSTHNDNVNDNDNNDEIIKNNQKDFEINQNREDDLELEAEFERFRALYPGNKRGTAIEFGNLKKKYPKKWREIVPLLVPAVERLLAYHKAANEAKAKGAQIFLPNFAYLQTWINNARWTDEYPAIETPTSPGEASPSELNETDSDTDFGGRQY